MRVRDWQRWQRTKGVTSLVLFLIALACGGGFDESAKPIPSFSGFLLFISLSFALMLNITKHMKR